LSFVFETLVFLANGFGLEPRLCCGELSELASELEGVGKGEWLALVLGFESLDVCRVRGEVDRF
jgi:hypothetical protein